MISRRNEIYINSTLALCPDCGQNELARIVAKKSGVYMERLCATSGVSSVKIANDYQWYIDRVNEPQDIAKNKNTKSSSKGCPFDCGICEWHSGSVHRASVSINSNGLVDNSNKRDDQFWGKNNFKNLDDIKKNIDHLMEANGCLEIINLTGRDLLLHPKFFEIVELLRDCDVKKVIVETDGLTGFDDFDFMNKLKECKVQIAYMKNTPNPPKNTAVNRTELAVKKGESLDRLDTLKIPTDIILLHIKGINDEEISCLVQEYMKKDFVRNIVIQNQLNNGCDNLPSYSQVPCTIDEIEEILARGNMISQKDFMSPAHCHPLCSSVAYYIVHNQHTVALSQILHKNDIKGIFEQCCTSNSDKDLSRRVRDGLNRFWSDQDNPSAINVLREFVNKIYLSNKKISDKKKWENAEKMTKGVYIHQYMVASNFDIDRVSRCGDVFIDHSNRIMPVCSHHLIHH